MLHITTTIICHTRLEHLSARFEVILSPTLCHNVSYGQPCLSFSANLLECRRRLLFIFYLRCIKVCGLCSHRVFRHYELGLCGDPSSLLTFTFIRQQTRNLMNNRNAKRLIIVFSCFPFSIRFGTLLSLSINDPINSDSYMYLHLTCTRPFMNEILLSIQLRVRL